MTTYLIYLWDKLRGSYWVIPSLCTVAAGVLAWLAAYADIALTEAGWAGPPWMYTKTAAAHTTLATIGGAMMAATGTVFSITVVTLSLASQQFGPRLLRRFLDDFVTQLALGVFLGSSLYSLLALRSVSEYADDVQALHLSALAGVGLAILSMIMLIVFIDNITTSIQAPFIVASVAQDLDDAVDRLFPPDMEGSDEVVEDKQGPAVDSSQVPSRVEGYLQAIAYDDLVKIAERRGRRIELRVRPGNFVTKGATLAEVSRIGREDEPDEPIEEAVNAAFIVGFRRTPRQDVGCAVNELVEVAVRALSPGINDPFTAISCVDRLGASLGRLAERPAARALRRDGQGIPRVMENPESFEGLLDSALDQVRQHSKDDVAVTLRMLEALEAIGARAASVSRRGAVRRHARMIAANCARATESDREAIDAQHGRVRLAAPKGSPE